MPDREPSNQEIERCRENLQDVQALLLILSPVCKSFEELLGICEHAQGNDALCRLILKLRAAQEQEKR